MIDAGIIGVRAVWDDVAARAAAEKYAADMRALMASVSGGGPMAATAGGGFFNRTGGGGNVAAAGAGGGNYGAFRFPSFDAEAEQVRGGMRTLARALYGQAIVLGQLTSGYGGTGLPGLVGGSRGGFAGPMAFSMGGGFAGAPGYAAAAMPAGMMGGNVISAAEISGGTGAAAGEGIAAAGAAGSTGFAGRAASGLARRLGRAGGFMVAAYGLHHLANTVRENYLLSEEVDKALNVGDLETAIKLNLEKAKSKREGLGGAFRAFSAWWGRGIGDNNYTRTDYAAEQLRLEQELESSRIGKITAQQNENFRESDRAARLHLLSGHRATLAEASDVQTKAHEQAELLREQARHSKSAAGRQELMNSAKLMEQTAGHAAFAMRWKDKEGTDTTMLGLRGDLEEQLERNKLHPGQAHAMSIFDAASMQVREMLINSTPQNAELARKLGLADLEGFKLQTIMGGNATSFNPFLEATGAGASKNGENVADILARIEQLMIALHASLGDIGSTSNPEN